MTCPYCQQPAEERMVPTNDGAPRDLVRCYPCGRERIADGRWILMGTHCAACRAPLWRSVRHPKYDDVRYLWPDPSHLIAKHFCFGADDGVMQPYCEPCVPPLGGLPPHQPEMGGAPITLGPVVGYVEPATRYAHNYTEKYGRFIAAHLATDLQLEESAAKALIALWCGDYAFARRVEGASSLRESGDGPPSPA
jgi:hypothetical protein